MPEPSPVATSPAKGALEAIDFAVAELGIRSFASLDNTPAFGRHAFYAIDKPTVQQGVLADLQPTRPRDQLLSAIELAAERPGLRVVDGHALHPQTIAEIGAVDAVLLINVLLHTVAPDWDQVLELYAPSASCFVIANPQWQEGERTVRLVDLGREGFLETVPPSTGHAALFDRLDEWYPPQQRPYRDASNVWQWAITDSDLKAKQAGLGFTLAHERDLGQFPRAERFRNKAFVFGRPELS